MMSTIANMEPSQNTSNILRETAYYRMDKLVWEMRQEKSGLEMKIQKTFFSSIPNACTGRELVQWLRLKLLAPTEVEALHLANALCRLGYIVPVNEKQITVKLDNSCYRIQRPALWPSRKWDSTSQEYAVHLLKKLEKGKSLESYEQSAISKLEQMHSSTWGKLQINAKDSVSKYSRFSKTDKEIEDSQDRSFWRVHRPPPGQRTHHYYKADGFSRNSVCMEVINQNRRKDILQKKIKFMKLYLGKSEHHSEQTGEKTIAILKNHSMNYQNHDPLLTKQDMTNPWIAIDEYFYEDLIDLEEKKHSKLDLESWTLGFRELITDSYGKQLFAGFLQQEYSLENLLFYEACEDLKQSPQSKVAGKIERIGRDFLGSSSKCEVNLDRLVLQTTLNEMKVPSRYCMDTAQRHIYYLMKDDCYPRFLKSDIYKQLLADFSDKRRDGKDRVASLRKFYLKRDRKTSVAPSSVKHHHTTGRPSTVHSIRHSSPIRLPKEGQKYVSACDLQSPHSSVSPYYLRRSSNASPSTLKRTQGLDPEFSIRKAGSMSSLVVTSSSRIQKATVKVVFEDDVDRVSDDSGTYSGVYSAATYSPKSKSGLNKLTLKKKLSHNH